MTHYPKKDTKTPTLANTRGCSQPYWILAQQKLQQRPTLSKMGWI